MKDLKQQLIRLGYQDPSLRPHLRPVLDVISMSKYARGLNQAISYLKKKGFKEQEAEYPNDGVYMHNEKGLKVSFVEGRRYGSNTFSISVWAGRSWSELKTTDRFDEIKEIINRENSYRKLYEHVKKELLRLIDKKYKKGGGPVLEKSSFSSSGFNKSELSFHLKAHSKNRREEEGLNREYFIQVEATIDRKKGEIDMTGINWDTEGEELFNKSFSSIPSPSGLTKFIKKVVNK